MTPYELKIPRLRTNLSAIGELSGRLTYLASACRGKLVFSTSLGIEDQVLLHGIVEAGIAADVFTLDTGRLFPETLQTIDETERRFGVRISVINPQHDDVEALIADQGVYGFRASIDARKACCHVRKVLPLKRALSGAEAWITGLRSGQSANRKAIDIATWDHGFGLIKVAPLADWSLDQVEGYAATHAIPINPLHAQGFSSIGCQPCTRAISAGEDIRAGRWWWEEDEYQECGLHQPARHSGTVT